MKQQPGKRLSVKQQRMLQSRVEELNGVFHAKNQEIEAERLENSMRRVANDELLLYKKNHDDLVENGFLNEDGVPLFKGSLSGSNNMLKKELKLSHPFITPGKATARDDNSDKEDSFMVDDFSEIIK